MMITSVGKDILFSNYFSIIINKVYFKTCFRNLFKGIEFTEVKYYFKHPLQAFFSFEISWNINF